MNRTQSSIVLAAAYAFHYQHAQKLQREAIEATAGMDTEKGDELQARADAAFRAAALLEKGEVNIDGACPTG